MNKNQHLPSKIVRMRNFVMLAILLSAASAASEHPSPRDPLNQLVQQLQTTPDDSALRQQIIKLAQDVKPGPVIPEEARRAFVEGNTIAKTAASPSGQTLAVQSFKEALKLAPWWGDAYYNLAAAQEFAGQLGDAKVSLRFYLLANPGEKDARDAQDRIYALEAKEKLAAKIAEEANSPDALATKAREREAQYLKSLDGAYFVDHWPILDGSPADIEMIYEIHGTMLVGKEHVIAILIPKIYADAPVGIRETFRAYWHNGRFEWVFTYGNLKSFNYYTVSDDGRTLYDEVHNEDGSVAETRRVVARQ